MKQAEQRESNKTMEQIAHIANEYIMPVFVGTIVFSLMIKTILWLTSNDPTVSEPLSQLAQSTGTITYTAGDILIVLTIMALASAAHSAILGRRKNTHNTPRPRQ